MAERLECRNTSKSVVRYSHRAETWAISFTRYRLPLPTSIGQHGRVGQQHQHPNHYKAMVQVPTEKAGDQGGGSGQLHGKNLWVKTSRRKTVSRQKITSYNVRPLLRDTPLHSNSKKNLGKPGWYEM